ncbi:MAG: hypothetical protein AAB408_04865 [Patescibacteria group bacterium]
MRIVCDENFDKKLKKLPDIIQEFYQEQETIFRKNWRDPRLHTKKLTGHPLAFSFRITRQYRVLFSFIDSDTAFFTTIAHRRDVYR